jgi:hypothetical protein
MAVLLRDKVCIVTGAASLRGIGYATAELFAEHGAKVVVADLAMNEKVATDIRTSIDRKVSQPADLQVTLMPVFQPIPTHALAFSLLRMTQAEGHKSFDRRLVIDCSLPDRRIDRLSAGPCSAGVAVGFACSGLEGRRIGRPALPLRWPSRPRRRALPSEGRGREFESRRVRQFSMT